MIAAEITTISNVALLADTALGNVIDNYWSIDSTFTTIDTAIISNSCITLDGMCMLSAKDPVGCCWRGQNAINVTMNNVYLQAFAVPAPPAVGGKRAPGLVIEGGYKISVGGHSEGPTPLVHAQKGSVTDCKIHFTGGRTACSPILVGADAKDFMWLERWDVYLVEFDNTWKQGKPALRLQLRHTTDSILA